MSNAPPTTDNAPLLLYDGECGLCDKTVQNLLRWDRRGVLRFAPLQGETAAPILERHHLPQESFDSMILVEHRGQQRETVTQRSDAALRLTDLLGGPWRLLALGGRLVPRVLRDALYGFVARHRLRLFPQPDACRVPKPEERARFLP